MVTSEAMNENQRKHIANSLRIIGLAQFASYGYLAIGTSEWLLAFVSASAYIGLEVVAFFVLKD